MRQDLTDPLRSGQTVARRAGIIPLSLLPIPFNS